MFHSIGYTKLRNGFIAELKAILDKKLDLVSTKKYICLKAYVTKIYRRNSDGDVIETKDEEFGLKFDYREHKKLFKVGEIVENVVFFPSERRAFHYFLDRKNYSGEHEWYYDSGEIRGRLMLKDGEIDGLCVGFYRDGKIEEEKNYKNGEKDGKCTKFRNNGQIEEEKNYKNGKKNGKHTIFSKDGKLIFEENYKDGVLDGPYFTHHNYGRSFDCKFSGCYKEGKGWRI